MEPITPKDLDKIKIYNKEGKLAACLAMGITLYFDQSHLEQVRNQVAICIEQYFALTRPHLRWYWIEEGKRRDIQINPPPPLTEVVGQLDEYDPFLCKLNGADDIKEASPFDLVALLHFKTKFKQIGFLTATVPFAFLEWQQPGFFKKMVHEWCQRLHPLHGYAGIYLSFSADRGEAIPKEPLTYPLLKRFPGIEINSPATVSTSFKQGIKGVNWLTVLSDRYVEKLGGGKALQSGLDDSCPLFTYPGGVVIQAGPYPQLGDIEQGIELKDYQKVYHLVKPVQEDYKSSIMKTPEGVDAKAFAQEWLHRFD